MNKNLEEYNGPDKVISSYAMRDKLGKTPPPSVTLPSGLPCLDSYIHDFEGGELITISGPTGNGKTLLAQTLTKSFADHKKHGLWFTYEVGAQQFLEQFGEDLPYFFLPSELTDSKLGWIEERIQEARVKAFIEYVMIDHLHFLVPFSGVSNMSLIIGGVCRELKKIALRNNVAIFLIAHMAKIAPETEPDIMNIRDSSFIGQESDTVLMVWRRQKRDGGAVCKIAKNRRYGVMGKKVYLIKEGNYLIDDYLENQAGGF